MPMAIFTGSPPFESIERLWDSTFQSDDPVEHPTYELSRRAGHEQARELSAFFLEDLLAPIDNVK